MDPNWISECLHVNESGHLTIGGCDTVSLAETYGTPLYVMDEDLIRKNMREFRRSIEGVYENGGLVAFASKACAFREMYRIAASEGCGADVVSCGEIYTAVSAGFPADKLYYHSNFKTDADLRMALSYGVGRIIVDNREELLRLSRIASEMGKTASIFLRITPGIDAHTHSFVKTGQIDSKFGFTLPGGEAMTAVKTALSLSNIDLKGLHCHIASQVFDEEPFRHAAQVMLDFMNTIRCECGVTLSELDLGGGFGVRYTSDDRPLSLGEYMALTAETLKKEAHKLDFPVPYIIIEPGRAIVAAAGITLYTVGGIKTIPDIRTYVSVDGGMSDNPRYALYQAEYAALIANKADQPADTVVTIAGRCCESGDLIQEHTPLQAPEEGDILAVLCTGAYNYSMSSNYNRMPRPAVVMVNSEGSRVVVQAETYEDLIQNDL